MVNAWPVIRIEAATKSFTGDDSPEKTFTAEVAFTMLAVVDAGSHRLMG